MNKIICSLSILFLFPFSLKTQDFARLQLEESPRHHEWRTLLAGGKDLHCFIAYPERSERTSAVIVIHENRGLTDWARSFADQVAAAGYLAIAPDLLSESGEGIHKTSDFHDSDAAREAIYQLDPEYVTAALDSVFKFLKKLPSTTGEVSVAGFCWGGSQSFRYATNNPDLKNAFVFYGSAPESKEAFARIEAPVYGFYAENDQRINAGIGETEKHMQSLNKTYDYVIYSDAGHAFMRRGDDPDEDEGNKKARDDAWERFGSILKMP